MRRLQGLLQGLLLDQPGIARLTSLRGPNPANEGGAFGISPGLALTAFLLMSDLQGRPASDLVLRFDARTETPATIHSADPDLGVVVLELDHEALPPVPAAGSLVPGQRWWSVCPLRHAPGTAMRWWRVEGLLLPASSSTPLVHARCNTVEDSYTLAGLIGMPLFVESVSLATIVGVVPGSDRVPGQAILVAAPHDVVRHRLPVLAGWDLQRTAVVPVTRGTPPGPVPFAPTPQPRGSAPSGPLPAPTSSSSTQGTSRSGFVWATLALVALGAFMLNDVLSSPGTFPVSSPSASRTSYAPWTTSDTRLSATGSGAPEPASTSPEEWERSMTGPTDPTSPTKTATSIASAVAVSPLSGCQVEVEHPGAELTVEPRPFTTVVASGFAPGTFPAVGFTYAVWAGVEERWLLLQVNGTQGWIQDHSILIGTKTGCDL